MESGRATLRNMRSKCRCSYVLQFAFRHAVSCVLHRPPSQVIHCTVLFHNKVQLTKNGLFPQQTFRVTAPHEGGEHKKTRRRAKSFERFEPHPINQAAGGAASGQDQVVPSPGSAHSVRPKADEPMAPRRSPETGVFAKLEASKKPLMILPQVHLRKPCYDFYFL